MTSGVYVLCRNGRPIYVGMSTNLPRRIRYHNVKSDAHYFQEMNWTEIAAFEAMMISILKPELNVVMNYDKTLLGPRLTSFTVILPKRIRDRLRSRAIQRGISAGRIMREAIRYYIEKESVQ